MNEVSQEMVEATLDVARSELALLSSEWKAFQQRVSSLAITHPELLGHAINQTSQTFDKFDRMINGLPEIEEVSKPEYFAFTLKRADVVATLMEIRSDQIQNREDEQ